jgi:protein SCO1
VTGATASHRGVLLAACACLWLASSHAAARFVLSEWPAAAAKPGFTLTDGDGHTRTLRDYEGQLSIVFFGFASCPDVCAGELFKLAQVIRKLGKAAHGIHVLFVSLDPQHDTPDVVKAYVTAFNPTFVGLTGSDAAVNAAADSFAIQFAKVPVGNGNYTINHSTGTYVVDRSGRLRLVGTLSTRVDDWVHDLTILVDE